MTKIFAIVLPCLAATFIFPFGETAQAALVECGDIITTNTTLVTNLDCANEDGLQIGADGVTLNLNGYTISSSGPVGSGVWIDGYDNVTIRNGAIRGFYNGVLADFGVTNLVIKDLFISGQVSGSIVVIRSSGVSISDVFISQPPGLSAEPAEAIRLANVDAADIRNVTVDGGVFGVLSIGGQLDDPDQISTGLKITNSTFSNVDIGILLNRNTRVMIWNNRITGTDFGDGCSAGIAVLGDPTTRANMHQNVITGCIDGIFTGTSPSSSDLIVSMNDVYSNLNGMILFNLRNSRISRNRVHLNQDAGIGLGNNSFGNQVLHNRVTGNELADMSHDESSAPNLWLGNTCVSSDEGAEVDCAQ